MSNFTPTMDFADEMLDLSFHTQFVLPTFCKQQHTTD